MSVPATLQAQICAETAYGGQVPTWVDAAVVWIDLAPAAASLETADGRPPQRIETATASARDHPLAAAGQRLLISGDANPWRVLALERVTPGKMTLRLDRAA